MTKLTRREAAMLRAARHAHPRRLCFVEPALQEMAIGLERAGLFAIYERGHSSGEIYAGITDAGRAALSLEQGEKP